jgi:DNA-binding HxlR family transcriptional regulator
MENPHTRDEFAVPRTATLPARRDFGQEDRRGAPKPAPKSIQVLTRLPTRPAQLKSPRIHPSHEPAIQRAIMLVEGKWRIAILCQLQDGPVRVGELKRRMPPISKKVLNQHLRRMEKDGLVVRIEFKSKVPHVEYALTDFLGYSVLRLLQSIIQWEIQHAPCATSAGNGSMSHLPCWQQLRAGSGE